MTVDELMALNGITDPASLQVGQELIISPGEAVAAPTTSATPVSYTHLRAHET